MRYHRSCILCCWLAALLTAPFAGAATDTLKYIGRVPVLRDSALKLVMFSSGMAIDADGSPRAYHPDSDKGLDRLSYAGKPGAWHSVVTDNGLASGEPLVQTDSQPQPGYYISTTSLQDKNQPLHSPSRYVNADSIPYFVLPPHLHDSIKLGDIALVYNTLNGRYAFAIYADTGPKQKIGEGSIYLAEQLGISSDPRTGGTDRGIFYLVFENSGSGNPLSREEISRIGQEKMVKAGIEMIRGSIK